MVEIKLDSIYSGSKKTDGSKKHGSNGQGQTKASDRQASLVSEQEEEGEEEDDDDKEKGAGKITNTTK